MGACICRKKRDRLGWRGEELRGPVTPKIRELLEFEADRAWRCMKKALPLVKKIKADSRATLWALSPGRTAHCSRGSKSADFDVFRSRGFRRCESAEKNPISPDGGDDGLVEKNVLANRCGASAADWRGCRPAVALADAGLRVRLMEKRPPPGPAVQLPLAAGRAAKVTTASM